MSGGSFDYLYCAETLGSERTGDIERMAERRAPVAEFAPRSAGAAAFAALWGEVADVG